MLNYCNMTNEELISAFPDRTLISIYKKARKLGLFKTQDISFKNRSESRKGDKSSSWKGGRKISKKGYVLVYKPGHHRACNSGYVMEHILVFEENTGIKVTPNCVVHHLNGNKSDNRICNLCLMEFGAHTSFHNYIRRK